MGVLPWMQTGKEKSDMPSPDFDSVNPFERGARTGVPLILLEGDEALHVR